MVEKLQKKQEASLSTHTATQPIPSAVPRHPARPRDPQQPSEGTDLPIPVSVRPPQAHLYLRAAPVTDPPHPNAQDYKSRQPPRPRQTPACGGAPRCTLGFVVLPRSPQEPRWRGVPVLWNALPPMRRYRGAGGNPPLSAPGAVPVLPFSALT